MMCLRGNSFFTAFSSPSPLNYDRNLALAAAVCKQEDIWLPYPSFLCSETNAKVNIFCIHCDPKTSLTQRDWQGRILGKRNYGSINALILRAKHKVGLSLPLMALYTICNNCCERLELYSKFDQIEEISNFNGGVMVSENKMFNVTHKEIEEILCSKVIIMEGKSTTSFKTFGEDGIGKEWAGAKLN